MQRDERNDVFEDEEFLDLSEGFDADDGGEVLEHPNDLGLCPDVICTPYKPRRITVHLDVTLVIDVTGSMESIIEAIKRDAVNLRTLLVDRLESTLVRKRPDWFLGRTRVRVIAYRDYNYDWEAALQPQHGPMLVSDFFDLEDEDDCASLQRFVDQLEATGGADEPESALEALHYAIHSDWDRTEGTKPRHVIMLFTDAPGIPLEDERNASNPHYPADPDMPKSLLELQAEWEDGSLISMGHRLLVFAPVAKYPWNEIAYWSQSYMSDVLPNSGLVGIDIEPIMIALTGSVA